MKVYEEANDKITKGLALAYRSEDIILLIPGKGTRSYKIKNYFVNVFRPFPRIRNSP
jgi:hypothetical protein